MKIAKALVSLAVLATVLVGVPVLLTTWTDPAVLLGVDWGRALWRPDDGRILLEILGIIGWLAWLAIVLTALAEVARVVSRGAISVSLPGMGWLRPSMRVSVAAVLAPFMGLGLTATANDASVPPAATSPATRGDDEVRAAEPRHAPEIRHYVVQPGDELWGIAEQELGSGERWRHIVGLNPGMTAETQLLPGTHLALPAGAPEEATVEVEAGDTLWGLAEEHLADPHRWPEIHRANDHLVTDPDHIEVGWVLSVPSPGDSPPGETATGRSAPPVTTEAADESAEPSEPGPDDGPPGPTETVPVPEASADHVPQPDDAHPAPPQAPPGEDDLPPETDGTDGESSPLLVLGPIGGVLAAGVFAGIAVRRRLQLLHRAVGHRLIPLTPPLERFLTALGRKAQTATGSSPEGPTTVTLGWAGDTTVHLELEPRRTTLLSGTEDLTSGMAAGMLTSLMCSPWSTSVSVTAVQPDQSWDSALDDPRLDVETSLDRALTGLQQLVAGRRVAMRHQDLLQVRANPDTSGAFAPHVTIFCAPLEPVHIQRIDDALSLGDVGVSVVAAVVPGRDTSVTATAVELSSEDAARLGSTLFVPQLLTLPARRAIAELFTASLDTTTHPAPWWIDDPLPPNVSVLARRGVTPQEELMPPWSSSPQHPTLLLLGDVELIGTSGPRPARATGQCVEYCAWLLENPNATPTAMTKDLLVAESTRRSNMSRLRVWLGQDPDGNPYLPDAYTGRITLHDDVSSDWERFCLLLAGGVNLASSATLRDALALVRGEPLHLVGFQWPWAGQLRADMVAMITDAAAVLAERCLEEKELEQAFWALAQGQKAAGDDENLAALEIQAFAVAGDRSAMDRAVRRLTRLARSEGRDLRPDTARRVQHAIHTGITASSALP